MNNYIFFILNRFYHLQLFEKKNGDFVFQVNWGRVGAKPQSRHLIFNNKYDAISEFKEKFYSKTGNEWKNRDNFIPKPSRYTLIKIDNSLREGNSVNSEIEKLNKRNEILSKKIKTIDSNLYPQVKSLMELIWDLKKMGKTLKELNFDIEKNPLGKLTYEQIQKGYKILTEIQNTLIQKGRQSTIIELTNQFYTNIPQVIYY